MEHFCRENKTSFVVTDSRKTNGSCYVFSCRHGKKVQSKSTGKRPIQTTIKKDCPAFVRFVNGLFSPSVLNFFIIVSFETSYIQADETIRTEDTKQTMTTQRPGHAKIMPMPIQRPSLFKYRDHNHQDQCNWTPRPDSYNPVSVKGKYCPC